MPTFTWWIDEPLMVGSSNPGDQELRRLRAQGFSFAVSLLEENRQPPRYEKKSAADAGWGIYSIPIEEGRAPSLDQIVDFAARLTALSKGTKVLVFCQSGKGRTAMMSVVYWIMKGLTINQAIARVSNASSATEWLTPERQRVLHEYERLTKA